MAHHVLLHFAAQALVHALLPKHQERRPKQPTNVYAMARKLARAQGVAVPRRSRAPKAEPPFTIVPSHGVLSTPRKPRGYEC